MKMIHLLIAGLSARATEVVERLLIGVDSAETLKSHATISGVQATDEIIRLRGENGEGSFISFNDPLVEGEWSMEITVDRVKLYDLQRAGVYLWYTAKPHRRGPFRGGDRIFEGLMIGIEVHEGRTDIVLTYNHGEIQKDLQVVHTRRNFKVELWCDQQLVSDTLKADEEIDEKSFRADPHHVALTTDYYDCPDWVSFHLKKLNILSRHESEDYNPHITETQPNSFQRRKSDEEVRHAAAEVAHVMTYLTSLVGTDDPNEIEKLFLSVTDALRKIVGSVEQAITSVREREAAAQVILKKDVSLKYSNILFDIERTAAKIDEVRAKLETLRTQADKRILGINRVIFAMGVAVVLVGAFRFIMNAMLQDTISIKNN